MSGRQIEPPRPEDALRRLRRDSGRGGRGSNGWCEELDAFYERGAVPLWRAEQDRDRIPELDASLREVDEGVAALAAAALGDDAAARTVAIVGALSGFAPWRALARGRTAEGGAHPPSGRDPRRRDREAEGSRPAGAA